jgi:hypothetical protein
MTPVSAYLTTVRLNDVRTLPDMHFCHPLQENISSFGGSLEPLLTGSFFLATPLKTNDKVWNIRNSYIHWYNDPVELRLQGTRKDYKTRGINRKCKSNNLDKIRINNTNNEFSFTSYCASKTRRNSYQTWIVAILSKKTSPASCWNAPVPSPRPPAYRFFFSGYATGQGSFTRKVRNIFTLKIIVSIFLKLFLILEM